MVATYLNDRGSELCSDSKEPDLPRFTGINLLLILLLFSLSLVVGCSTLATTIGGATGDFDCSHTRRIPRVYSGVAADISHWHTGPPEDRLLVFIDLPFSAFADTLLLPYSIPMQKKHGDLCPGDQKP